MKKVFVAMSGGVDSSVAAALLKREEYEVTGVFMKGWSDTAFFKDRTMCPWVQDQEAARSAAGVLGIPFYTWDVEREYKERVVDYMVSSYRAGITPNPDVICNKEIKFGIFLKRACALGADFVATGHYARVRKSAGGGFELLAGVDKNKDQSYFLWTLTQEQLSHILFPIGGMTKPKVRTLAREFNLPNAERKDSQGVCFVGELEVFEFLKSRIAPQAGPVLTASGRQVGEHQGAAFYTIGQRHGIGSPGGGTAYYVAAKDVRKNVLYVAEGNRDPALFKNTLLARDAHWIAGALPAGGFPLACFARIRYRQPLQECAISAGAERTLAVSFSESQRAVTPGQSIVLYAGDGSVLGGGVISQAAH